MSRPQPVWDLAVRCFHWLIVVGVVLSWWTGEEEAYERHEWIGYSLLVLVVFRVLWGLWGSTHARFSDFLRGPKAVKLYLQTGESAGPGHNPLGGWSVVALLALLFLQAVSGMFNSDDVLFSGPLHYWASVELRDAMGVIHEVAFDLLCVMVALHIAAVLYYQLRRKQPLLQAMIHGYAEGKEGRGKSAPLWRALIFVAIAAAALWGLLSAAPQPVAMW